MTGTASARSDAAGHGPVLSVVMPVFNGAGVLPLSLPPLLAMKRAGEIVELLIVDDGSTDATLKVAREMGVSTMPSGGRLGPGGARNIAARSAAGDTLWFVDADVVVHEDAARLLSDAFRNSGASAVYGCYDDQPAGTNFLSQYKNLAHHHYHLREPGEAETFWAGCGAIRKDDFLACGGFDAARYPYPSIEDIELGFRMRQRGLRIHLAPEVQGRHLKVWRLGNMLHTDIFRRALPWSRLIVACGAVPNALNVRVGERVNAGLAAALLLSVVLAVSGVVSAALPIALAVVAAYANRGLFQTFHRARGALFAARGVAFHQLYYLYSSAIFGYCWLRERFFPLREAPGGGH